MRRILMSIILATAASYAAYAQDPAPKADPNAALPPTNRMEQTTPTMKIPEGQQQTAPTGRVGEAVPPLKSTDSQSADTGAKKPATFVADEQWVGRYVYSSDGKDLGKIAAVKNNGALSDIFFDMGGFLGIGATRKHVTSDQVQDVQNDRIVLRLSEADAENLRATEDTDPAQK
jgi:PRC-barrel domain protein